MKDFDSDKENFLVSFSKNGLDLGVAFRVDRAGLKKHLSGQQQQQAIFFPHVLSKNLVFEMNFGQRVSLIGDEPFAPITSGFELLQKLPLDKRFCNETRSTYKKDYEV